MRRAESPRRIAQSAQDPGYTETLFGQPEDLRLRLLETDDAVDTPIEKSAGFRLALAVVAREDVERCGVDPGQDRPFGIVVVVGRRIAGETPHPVGTAPAQQIGRASCRERVCQYV